ncbi:hypothetical protein [Actinoplanes subglobosus]|uniref:Uncharacterized protein n=1 Tax=Actinoplanes subglobosus TaxID=1547892 RepID=A0ABV8J8M3_9ACTN
MESWSDGDLVSEFDQRLDELLAEVDPGWRPEEPPEPYRSDQAFRAYHRRERRRMHLGEVLREHPDTAAACAPRVLAAVACDEDVSANKQLLHPVMAVVGRRAVQRYLISVVEHEPAHKKVCAVRAWYWSQVSLRYRSFEDFREERPTPESRAADDDVADLRADYRNACLAAFVEHGHPPTREWLSRGFLLVEDYFPPNLHHLVARARAIAEADPERYHELLGRESDGTTMAQIGVSDR